MCFSRTLAAQLEKQIQMKWINIVSKIDVKVLNSSSENLIYTWLTEAKSSVLNYGCYRTVDVVTGVTHRLI